jgi:hypothetical protein
MTLLFVYKEILLTRKKVIPGLLWESVEKTTDKPNHPDSFQKTQRNVWRADACLGPRGGKRRG